MTDRDNTAIRRDDLTSNQNTLVVLEKFKNVEKTLGKIGCDINTINKILKGNGQVGLTTRAALTDKILEELAKEKELTQKQHHKTILAMVGWGLTMLGNIFMWVLASL